MMDRPQGARRVLRLLSCIRFDEVLVLQGAPLLGAVFAMGHFTYQSAAMLLLLMAGNAFCNRSYNSASTSKRSRCLSCTSRALR